MKNVNVRMPDDLHERVKRVAAEDNRSLNGEIITLLTASLALREMTTRLAEDDQ